MRCAASCRGSTGARCRGFAPASRSPSSSPILYTQLDPLTRMPRRLGHVLSELEQGSLKIGVVPTGLGELEASLHSIANRLGAAIIVDAL